MISVTYNFADAALAERLQHDLKEAGFEIGDGLQHGRENILVAVLSPQAERDAEVQNAITNALDNGQHVIPVLAKSVPLPKLIDHLAALDLSKDYESASLIARIRGLMEQRAYAVKVRTPRVKAANRRIGLALGLLALLMAAVGIYLVGGGLVGFPQEEYNTVDTMAAATIDSIIHETLDIYATYLPNGTVEAAEYQSTLRAVPTIYRPYVAETATAVALTPQP
jgi:hypothetical protein